MSQPTTSTSTSTSAAPKNPKPYPPRAQALDCFLFILFVSVSAVLICATPAITRALIFFQPALLDFNVNSSSLAILNISSHTITTNWDVTLSAKNPNSNTMFYNEITASALKGIESLSNITIAKFEQPGNSQSSLKARFDGMLMQFDNCTSANNAVGVLCGGGAVNLTLELQAKIKFGGWTWPLKTDSIRVVCEDVKVGFPSNVTTIKFGSSKCDVSGHWKRIVTKGTSIFWGYIYVVAMILFIFFVSL